MLEKTPESPLDSEEIKPILREINPEYSQEGLMLKRKLQYFGHLMGTADSLEKSLMLGKIEGRKIRGHQRMRWLAGWHHRCNGHKLGQISGDAEGQEGLVLQSIGNSWVTEQQSKLN